MSNEEKQEDNVIIGKDAFRNLITHTYRFGHHTLGQQFEVLGVCLGSITDNNSYRIKNAIPITHGKELDINSNQQIQLVISQMKEKYNSSELEVIGVYGSHIDNKTELSENDKKNLLHFEQKVKAKSIFIIINRDTILKTEEKNFGIKSFRLKDDSELAKKEVKELKVNIEKPESLLVYKWIQKFVEDYQKEDPILIKEVMETEEKKKMDLQEIPQEAVKVSKNLFPDSSIQKIQNSLNKSLENIIDDELNKWNEDLTSKLTRGNEQLINTIIQIKKNIPRGLNMIKKRIENLINETLESFKGTIYRHIKELDNSDDLYNDITKSFKDTREKVDKILNGKINENYKTLEKETGTFQDLSETLETEIKTIKERSEDINTLIESDQQKITAENKKFNAMVKKKINDANVNKTKLLAGLKEDISNIAQKELQNMQDQINELQKISNKIKEI